MSTITISQEQVDRISPLIGAHINPVYNNSNITTPVQKNKITTIALSAMATVAGFYCAFVSFQKLSIIYPLLAVTLLTGAAIGVYYSATVRDYDNPRERRTYINTIAKEFLTDIAKSYPPKEVIGYSLLGENGTPNLYTTYYNLATSFYIKKAEFNTQIAQSQPNSANIRLSFEEHCRHINTQFETLRPRLSYSY